ncbi:hypothetical protein B0H14DRAFT_3788254 [Mycena olivaceomarginata]|nr:hypothetical protein B0H14DRAFT_3788254 [Mycena olivaceomarginata]
MFRDKPEGLEARSVWSRHWTEHVQCDIMLATQNHESVPPPSPPSWHEDVRALSSSTAAPPEWPHDREGTGDAREYGTRREQRRRRRVPGGNRKESERVGGKRMTGAGTDITCTGRVIRPSLNLEPRGITSMRSSSAKALWDVCGAVHLGWSGRVNWVRSIPEWSAVVAHGTRGLTAELELADKRRVPPRSACVLDLTLRQRRRRASAVRGGPA